jgi:hypothetical protein
VDEYDAPPEIVNAPVVHDEWALGAGEGYNPLGIQRPPWLVAPPPKKRPFNWPSGGKSPSWFKRLSRCLLEHANRYRRGIKDPTGLTGVVGLVIHGAIEDALNIRAFPGRRGQIPIWIKSDELMYLAELQKGAIRQDLSVIEGEPVDQIVTAEVLARVRHIIAGMDPIKADNIWIHPRTKKAGAEYIWQFHLGAGLLIAGIADLVQAQPHPTDPRHPPLEIVITDWKTGLGQLPTKEELALDAQAGLQLCWAKRAFPYTPTIRFRLVNVALNKTVSVEWSEGLDQLFTSFARACWHLWCVKDEEATIGSHCSHCAYRFGCNPYAKYLQTETFRNREGIEAMDVPQLMEAHRQAKVLYDLAEQRKKDASRLLLDALGKQKTHRAGNLVARKKRREQPGWKDEAGMLQSLSTVANVPLEQVLSSCIKIKKAGVEGIVKTLSLEKQGEARKLLDTHSEPTFTPYWIEVSEKEPVI